MPRAATPLPAGFNVSGVPTHQIWIDSFCNGYASAVGQAGLRFGDPAQSNGLAVGDDLCMGHENRLYARIQNRGTGPATNVRVHFDIGDPAMDQGLCAQQQCAFNEVGVADAQHFPVLASLPPGAEATVWVPWVAPQPAQGQSLFAAPALRVRVDPVSGELATGGHMAFSRFDRVQTTLGSPAPVQAANLLYTPSAPETMLLHSISNLPNALTVSPGQNPVPLNLVPNQQLRLPVSVAVSGQAQPAAGRYAANITLSGFTSSSDSAHDDFGVRAARTVGIDIVEPSGIDLQAVASGGNTNLTHVSGQLHPARQGQVVALDYMTTNQASATALVNTDANGKFQADFAAAPGSSVRALWVGDGTYSPAVTNRVVSSRN
jgi:hypothetical protein